MNAAVFRRNIAMSGTCSMVMTAVARSTARRCVSVKVPAAAYTSIIGTADSLRGGADELGGLGRVGHHREVAGRDLDGGGAHTVGEQPFGVGWDGLVLGGDQVPGRQRLPGWYAHHVGEGGPGEGLLDGVHRSGVDR